MNLRPRTWALLSVVLLIAAALCWQAGNRRAARDSRPPDTNTPSPTGPAARPRAATKPFPIISRLPAPPTMLASLPARATNLASDSAALTNRFRYRLSNTPQTLAQLARNDRAVILRNALIDTGVGKTLAIPDHLRATGDPGNYIVQARGVITEEFRRALKTAGAEIISYVPNNAYLVRAGSQAAASLAASPLTQSVLPFEPYYKIEPALLAQAVEQTPLPEGSLLRVTLFPGQRETAVDALASLGASVLSEEHSPFGPTLLVQTGGPVLPEIAQLSAVQLIEKHRERIPANDLTRARLKVSANTLPATPNYAPPGGGGPLTGAGVLVNVSDTGVWAGHPDLTTARVFGDVPASLGDADGHGTFVAGTIASSGANSHNLNAKGSPPGSDFRGMAPSANLLSVQCMDAFEGAHTQTDEYLQRVPALSNAFICNNSWTYGVRDYNLSAASFDAATRDALDDRTGAQPLLFVFAAGDSGDGSDNGQGGAADTVESPGTAKNVITVGASELPRFITNQVTEYVTSGGEVTTNISEPWLGTTDSSNQVASFSSRGNTGISPLDGVFGRYKPDVVAPGAMLVSCRSSNFNRSSPSNYAYSITYPSVFLPAGSTNGQAYLVAVPNPISFTVTVTANAQSPVPFPDLPIFIAMDNTPGPGDFVGNNTGTLLPPALVNGSVNFAVGNPTTNDVSFSLTATLVLPAPQNDYWSVLSGLNDSLDPNHLYRYESGSSMSAAAVSGVLALMQQYFQRDLGITTESPALLKALLINGARSMNQIYDFDFRRATADHHQQGWGLVNVSNSVPASPAGGSGVVKFVEQDATNALATGMSHTRTVTINPSSRIFPLRLTLVWTDPAANPLVGLKLVNDLDLLVTNLDNGQVFVGNFFAQGSLYSGTVTPSVVTNGSGTNSIVVTNEAASGFSAALDVANNVENVYLQPPLGSRYSVTVRARRVNVNGVDAAPPSGVVQDYALVASCGIQGGALGTGLTLDAAPVVASDPSPFVQAFAFGTNPVFLANQRVGANAPYIVSTNGMDQQWNFYVFTNATDFTNVAFLTFAPLNAGFLQPNRANPPAPRYNSDADIDLYVSQQPGLTNLDPVVIASSDRSVNRGGEERIIYSNAAPGAVYYVGIKSEDQQVADYSLVALASQNPFSSLDANGSQVIHGYPVVIPDGSPDSPGYTTIVAVAMMPMTIQRVVAETTITHENIGDLFGNLSHQGQTHQGQFGQTQGGINTNVFVVLNNHTTNNGPGWVKQTVVYSDSRRGDIPNAIPPDGPGTLLEFVGMEASGTWFFDISDNALQHTGMVDGITITIEPQIQTNGTIGYPPRRLGSLRFDDTQVFVPDDATNLHICVTGVSGGDVTLYVQRDTLPTLTSYLWSTNVSPPGACFDWSIYDNPPLTPGIYWFSVYNPNAVDVMEGLSVQVQRNVQRGTTLVYAATNSTPLFDDAVTNSSILITNSGEVAMIEVGVRIDHPRASDLVLHLIDPSGLRLLLAENRGLTNTQGYGINLTNDVTTNIVALVLDDGFENAPVGFGYTNGTVLSGWTVDAGDVDILAPGQGFFGLPNSGIHCLDVQGFGTFGPGAVSTNIATVPGASYQLSFAYTKNPNTVQGDSFVALADVNFNGQVLSLTYTNSNTASNLNWFTTNVFFSANSATTRLELVSGNNGDGGMYFDTFKMYQIEVVTNLYRYAWFSEDVTKTTTPIKFAPPPFTDTNTVLTNLLVCGFENTAPTNYAAGAFVEGWQVLTNEVTVINDNALAYAGTQCVALSSAVLSTNLLTVPGSEYRLTLAHRGAGIVGWWPGDTNATDIVNRNNGTFQGAAAVVPAYVADGFTFTNGDAAVTISNVSVLAFPGSFSIEAWINPAAYPANPVFQNEIFMRGDDRGGFDPYYLCLTTNGVIRFHLGDATGNSSVVDTPAPAPLDTWTHVAAVFDGLNGLMRVYTNGILAAFQSTSLQPLVGLDPTANPGVGIGNLNRGVLNDQAFDGEIDEVSAYHRALSDAEVFGIWSAGAAGKFDAFTPTANFDIEVAGVVTNTMVSGDTWTIQNFTFTAASTNTELRLVGHPLGVLLDSIQVIATGNRYYLPEESLAPMFGEDPFGVWQLEVWDNRLGALLPNTALVSWQLNITLARTNAVVIPVTVQAAGFGPTGFTMKWQASPSATFQVQYTDSFAAPSWNTFPGTVSSSTGAFIFTDSTVTRSAAIPTRFYRVVQQSP